MDTDTGATKNAHDVLVRVAQQFPIGTLVRSTPCSGGLVHDTYLLQSSGRTGPHSRSILQRLNPVFLPSVLDGIERVTSFLVARGMRTPYLIRAKNGQLCVEEDGRYWRLLSYVPGSSFNHSPDRERVESAAKILGRFHRETGTITGEFKHSIPDFHNTPRIMRTLYELLERFKGTMRYDALAQSGNRILNAYTYLWPTIPTMELRVIHGDPKFSNVRFDEEGREAVALLDLDTLGKGRIIIDLGDAIRSWCNVSRLPNKGSFSLEYFVAFLRGYLSTAPRLKAEERASILEGAELIALELAARFIIDAFEETYFKLDTSTYKSLFDQNRARAAGQLAFYEDLQQKRTEALAILKKDAANRANAER